MEPTRKKAVSPARRLLRNRNFLLLWSGQSTSLLGDQFYMIALPWLVLQATGSALALGTVLALEGIPRALFMLVGGAITDRFSARTVMLVSDVARLAMTAILTVLIVAGAVQLWMIYAFALAFGLVDGFFQPAASSMVPHLVHEDDLQTGNALTQGTGQLSLFVGPVLAGMVVAIGSSLGHSNGGATGARVAGGSGIALAFAVDAGTFLLSVLTLLAMRVPRRDTVGEGERKEEALLASIRAGMRHMWTDPLLRTMFILIGAINFLVVGPFFVGIPVLAESRLPEGAAAFGLVFSAYGGGNLLGYVLAGSVRSTRGMGLIVPAVFALFGVGIASLGFVTSTAAGFAIVLVMGLGNGYIAIVLITWLQKNTPKAMLGRLMSIVMFASVGLVPVSQAVAGAVIGVSLQALFVGAGGLMVLVAVRSALLPEMRTLNLDLGEGRPDASAGEERAAAVPAPLVAPVSVPIGDD